MSDQTRESVTIPGPPPREFVVINSQLQYFCGFARGGVLRWVDDHSSAKRLDDVRKFETLKRITQDEIAMGWCDEDTGTRKVTVRKTVTKRKTTKEPKPQKL
jgi:hypothetical protein